MVTRYGRYPDTVEARSVLCYWAAQDLGISTLKLSKRFGILQKPLWRQDSIFLKAT
jgi:hypothetical protein